MKSRFVAYPKALDDCLEFYKTDEDFKVRTLNPSVWAMEGIKISWTSNDRALYAKNIKEIMERGKFKEFMVTSSRNGATEVWFYNRTDIC